MEFILGFLVGVLTVTIATIVDKTLITKIKGYIKHPLTYRLNRAKHAFEQGYIEVNGYPPNQVETDNHLKELMIKWKMNE